MGFHAECEQCDWADADQDREKLEDRIDDHVSDHLDHVVMLSVNAASA